MGRIKTAPIKRTTEEIVERYSDKLTEDYSQNKKIISSLAEIHSKKLLNVIAGYVTRLMKTRENI